jgi:hypothetical protein
MTTASRLHRVTLRLGRNPDAGFPDGNDREGYVLVLPLDRTGRLDPSLWQARRADCTVRRFSDQQGHDADGRLSHRGGRWFLAWDEEDEGPDGDLVRLADHDIRPGAYLTIQDADGPQLTYRISDVLELP